MLNNVVVASAMDLGSSALCLTIAVGCVWLAQVILHERAPMLDVQRAALYFVAGASFANAFTYWPDWALIGGHRPTGLVLNLSVAVVVWVMVVRGNMVNGGRMSTPS